AQLNQYSKFDQWTMAYDQNGNTTQKGTQQFSYNFRNQLVRAIDGGSTVTLKYDPFGRRIEKIGTGNTIKFYYAGNQVIEERNSSDQVTKQYIYGNGIDELLRLDVYSGATSAPYYVHTNDIGSTTAITDSTGALVERVSYDTFGLPSFTDATGQPIATSSIGNMTLFQGREYDSELNLYNYRARYYDPIMGRFLQMDPVGYKDSMNLYQGMGMNPINSIDPMGLYNQDFHFYVIYYLMRARGWDQEISEQVAGLSQYVDEDEFSSPTSVGNLGNALIDLNFNKIVTPDRVGFFHFFSSNPQRTVYRKDEMALQMVREQRKAFQNAEEGLFVRLGVSLHIFADTYAHEKYKSPIGHAYDLYEPDKILKNAKSSEKALQAAENIYGLIPRTSNCFWTETIEPMEWKDIESLLKKVFEPIADQKKLKDGISEAIVISRMKQYFGEKYGDINYDIEKFKKQSSYFVSVIKKYLFKYKR
ncbi:MAG: RHS repeat-associated core domain-containing protein, partial [Thermodesulfovibrionales bacterium]|nr:RHS repeat-associated core domain-containing protein [Thermodesulfovibrionales bacterium]